ncbi:hypothetical protein POF50_004325 [Streptomyces sp. SL13]|uniref:ATP-grasp domain-containing protein n=1 Tax=Streptantibioticus silvisoli TaxID=2705255 RepID=A0AA90KF68_9ACTN|nr:hypothetical protein [Streptantibioticus silvisoli]MDI5968579.1 hypothetical protein [Streptantibioticus silvisoli]
MDTRTYDVAYVTYEGKDGDRPAVMAALGRQGLTTRTVRWSDDGTDWADFRVVLVRSAWDYPAFREDFLERMRKADQQSLLLNPLSVLEWNTDKSYLRVLGSRGVPVVPTGWLAAGPDVTAADAAAAVPHGWQDLVVKPSVGAGGRHCLLTGDRERAWTYAAQLARRGAHVLIQPYLAAVDGEGESSLVYIGGAYSHAVRRSHSYLAPGVPVPGLLVPGEAEAGRVDTHEPSEGQREVAEAALAAIRGAADLTYARIDLIPDAAGRPLLAEVELTEPFLFLNFSPTAADLLARAVARTVAASR